MNKREFGLLYKQLYEKCRGSKAARMKLAFGITCIINIKDHHNCRQNYILVLTIYLFCCFVVLCCVFSHLLVAHSRQAVDIGGNKIKTFFPHRQKSVVICLQHLSICILMIGKLSLN